MKRRLFNLAAAVSLGMMLAVVVLWVRSIAHIDNLVHYAGDSWTVVAIRDGTLRIEHSHWRDPGANDQIPSPRWKLYSATPSENILFGSVADLTSIRDLGHPDIDALGFGWNADAGVAFV